MVHVAEQKKYDFDRTVRLVGTIILVVAAIYVIKYLSGILLPFLVGCVLAYMLDPIVRFIMRIFHTKKRTFPAVLTMVLFFGGLLLAIYLVMPTVIDNFVEMGHNLSKYVQKEVQSAHMPSWLAQYVNEYLNPDAIAKLFSKEQWMNIANEVMKGSFSVLGSTFHVIFAMLSWLLALLYMFFVLIDYDVIARSFKAAVPQRYRKMVFRIFDDVTGTMSSYFRGQALVSLFVGIIFAVEFYIIGLPMPIVFGLSIGVLNMVPYLQLISIPVAAFFCVVQSVATGQPFWPLAWWTVGAYCLCQLIQDMILIPLIMRSQMGLRPAIVFLALAIWSYILGFIGLIIALPITSLLISYYSEFVLHQPTKRTKKKETRGDKFVRKIKESAQKLPADTPTQPQE